MNIAVIDDDEAILDATKILLEYEGWSILTYYTAESFLHQLDTSRLPDCLILDPHLPGLSGAAIMEVIAARQIYIPVIGLTARPESAAIAAIVDAGAHTILTKPATIAVLVESILAALKQDRL